jgi:hypothetical protein
MVKFRLISDRRGQAVVETALTFIPFFLLIGFIFQSSYWYLANQIIQQKGLDAVEIVASSANPCQATDAVYESGKILFDFQSKAKISWSVLNNPTEGGSGNGQWDTLGLPLYFNPPCRQGLVPVAWRSDGKFSGINTILENGAIIVLSVEYELPFQIIPLKVFTTVNKTFASVPSCLSLTQDATYPYC